MESEHFERHKMELRFLGVSINWHEVDRFLVGESWVGSQLEANLLELCEGIGPRWAGSDAEGRATAEGRGGAIGARDRECGAGGVAVVLEEV